MKNSVLFLLGVMALFLLSSCSSDKSPDKKTPDNKTPDKENPNKDPETPNTDTAAEISRYDCTTGTFKGVLVAGVLTIGVTKTIKATVTTAGTYSISTNTVNGVTFEGSGKFETKGAQDVILTAKGSPIRTGEYEFALGTPPANCSFKLTVDKNPSSNGTAVVLGYDCSAAVSKGKLVVGDAATGVTQTITAVVLTEGSYDISTTAANGVRFAGKGAFPTAGTLTIELTAIGTPTEAGTPGFTLSNLPADVANCSFLREITAINPDIAPTTGVPAVCDGSVETKAVDIVAVSGKKWMDRNLGATRVAASKDDYQAYGCLYQWGRGNDGHANIMWISSTNGRGINGTTTTLSAGDTPGDSKFITPGNAGDDWRSKPKNGLWKEPGEINNPCPTGYRIPTDAEFNDIVTYDGPPNSDPELDHTIVDLDTAFKSKFKFVAAGSRNSDGSLIDVGSKGKYWTSSFPESDPTNMNSYYFNSGSSGKTDSNPRVAGLSVRCIKNE